MARIDFDEAAPHYEHARALPPRALEAWCEAIRPFLALPLRRPILDVGSGTGQFARAFAEAFGCRVVGIEPSWEMLRLARRAETGRVRFVRGSAEQVPLPKASCDAAWASTVIHHVTDLERCAHELSRVLSPGAPLLIRGAFPGRQHGISLFHFFPEAAAVVESFPTPDAVVRAFASAGFAFESLRPVRQESCATLRELRAKIDRRADTTLAALSPEAFARGLQSVDRAIATSGDAPVVDELDLLVLRRGST